MASVIDGGLMDGIVTLCLYELVECEECFILWQVVCLVWYSLSCFVWFDG